MKQNIFLRIILIIFIVLCGCGAIVFFGLSTREAIPRHLEKYTESETTSDANNASNPKITPSPKPKPEKKHKGTEYTTFAIIGIDARTNEIPEKSNTDVMILATLNNWTGSIKMTSIYRDTLLNITSKDPENTSHIFDKANSAYANGGIDQFKRMVSSSLDITVDEYVIVNFLKVAQMIDALGGIDVWMTKQEVIHMDNYCVETSAVTGLDYERIEPAEEAQLYHLNGVQAVSYARIRYTAGNDMKRTQRQRVVIEKVMALAKKRPYTTLRSLIFQVFPGCISSLDVWDVISYARKADGYAIEATSGFPTYYLGHRTYTNGKSLDPQIPVTLEMSVEDLHKFLYNDASYKVPDSIHEISEEIISLTGIGEDSLENAMENSRIRDSGGEADVVK